MTPTLTPTRTTPPVAGQLRQRGAHTLAGLIMALLGAAGGAQAQDGVVISGFLDIGVYRAFDGDRRVGTIQRSHLTFSAQESLGGGLSATARLQHRFDLDTGQNEDAGRKPLWHGESTVGLSGGFGHVRLGRALDVIYAHDWAYDPWDNFDRIASPAWNNWHWNYASDRSSNNGNAEYGRLDKGVFYDSPQLGGFTLHFSGSFDDSGGRDSGNNTGLALRYNAEGVSAMLARSRNRSGDTVGFAGLAYTHGAWTLMGAWDRSVFKAATDSVAQVWTLGLRARFGANTFKAGWGRRDVDGSVSQFLGLGAAHALSARSSVYLSAGRQDPRGASASTAFGVGISHSF
jgi:predicted porin